MENTKNKTLIIIAKNDFAKQLNLPITKLSEELLDENFVKLIFEGSESEIDKICFDLCTEMVGKLPSKREIMVIADEKGIIYDERPKAKRNCVISPLQNIEELL